MIQYYFRIFFLFLLPILLISSAYGQQFSPDPAFQPPQFKSQLVDVQAVPKLPDGKLILGGIFDYANGTPVFNLVRLTAKGTVDDTFGATFKLPVNCLALQPDGKIVVGSNGVHRLNHDGSRDQTFDSGLLNNYHISAIALQPDGKLLVGGDVLLENGIMRSGLTRLNADGSADLSFTAPATLHLLPHSIVVLEDRKIIVGGASYKSSPNAHLLRLNPDGSEDLAFNIGAGPSWIVKKVLIGPDQKILIAGYFIQVGKPPEPAWPACTRTELLILRLKWCLFKGQTFNS